MAFGRDDLGRNGIRAKWHPGEMTSTQFSNAELYVLCNTNSKSQQRRFAKRLMLEETLNV
jgi:hypothetical protein